MRVVVVAGGWLIISEGDPSALAVGVIAVLLALGASVLLPSPSAPPWSVTGLLRYGVVFLVGSWRGGLDVARRALSPRLPLSPAIIPYRLRLRTEPARQLFAATLSLQPGTSTVAREDDLLEVHVLAAGDDGLVPSLRALEAHVARAVGERLEEAHG